MKTPVSLTQGFYIDLEWLLGDLINQVGAQTMRESERLIRPGDAPLDESCEVCTDVLPLLELGIEVPEGDDALGLFQVAVNTQLIHDRFNRQRVIFGALAAMMILALMTGMVLIERTVRRDLEQAERTQNFVSAVTHELRTPLAAIRLYGEMLLEGWTDDKAKIREYHRRILRETSRLSTLVERVLQKGRLASGPSATHAVDLNTLVSELREELSTAHPPDDRWREGNEDLNFELAGRPAARAGLPGGGGRHPDQPGGERAQVRALGPGRARLRAHPRAHRPGRAAACCSRCSTAAPASRARSRTGSSKPSTGWGTRPPARPRARGSACTWCACTPSPSAPRRACAPVRGGEVVSGSVSEPPAPEPLPQAGML